MFAVHASMSLGSFLFENKHTASGENQNLIVLHYDPSMSFADKCGLLVKPSKVTCVTQKMGRVTQKLEQK